MDVRKLQLPNSAINAYLRRESEAYSWSEKTNVWNTIWHYERDLKSSNSKRHGPVFEDNKYVGFRILDLVRRLTDRVIYKHDEWQQCEIDRYKAPLRKAIKLLEKVTDRGFSPNELCSFDYQAAMLCQRLGEKKRARGFYKRAIKQAKKVVGLLEDIQAPRLEKRWNKLICECLIRAEALKIVDLTKFL